MKGSMFLHGTAEGGFVPSFQTTASTLALTLRHTEGPTRRLWSLRSLRSLITVGSAVGFRWRTAPWRNRQGRRYSGTPPGGVRAALAARWL